MAKTIAHPDLERDLRFRPVSNPAPRALTTVQIDQFNHHGFISEICLQPRMLDYVEDLIGPDILCWVTHYFSKEPYEETQVSWHQDASYWPLTPSRTVTGWLAIDRVDPGNGPVRFIPGSHLHGHIAFEGWRGDQA